MKQRNLYKIRFAAAAVVGFLTIAAFAGWGYKVKIFDFQVLPLVQRLIVDISAVAVIAALFLAMITLLWGRVYCSVFCPFGMLQELLQVLLRRKRFKPRKNRPYKYFAAAAVLGSLCGGSVLLARWIDPYTLSGSALSGALTGVAAFLVVTVMVWFWGRLFCANICPAGTLLGVAARHARNRIFIDCGNCVSCGLCARNCPTGSIDFKNKKVDNETCVKCFKCVSVCPHEALKFGHETAEDVPFSPGRRKLLISGSAVVLFAAAYKSGLRLAEAAAKKVKNMLLPPGAGNAADFANRCLNCNLCVGNCPMKILKKADADYEAVHVDYGKSFCDYNCNKCSAVCPSGAIKRIGLAQKQKLKIGTAAVDESVCIKCGLCVHECPREIIRKEDGGYPQIVAAECIGCGACQAVCPVQAIVITAAEEQKII